MGYSIGAAQDPSAPCGGTSPRFAQGGKEGRLPLAKPGRCPEEAERSWVTH